MNSRWPLFESVHVRGVVEASTTPANATITSSSATAITSTADPYVYGLPSPLDVDDTFFATLTFLCLAALVVLLAVYRVALGGVRYTRTLVCLTNSTQKYFRLPDGWFGWTKENILYAPLFRKRHMRELQLLGRLSIGILPTRLQTLFLVGIIAMNVTFCTWNIPWSNAGSTDMMAILRQRTGTMSVVNMIPLVIMAGRNNPLIKMLNISFDTFNLMHRWFGRIVVSQALAHTIVWTIPEVQSLGWNGVTKGFQVSQLLLSGLIGTVLMLFILLQATATLRHALYETFLHIHQLVVIGTLAALYIHLHTLPTQVIYVQVTILAWVLERLVRIWILLYRNYGSTSTTATVDPLPGDALRVTVRMARPWTFRPGQYMFLTIPSVGLWTSHPFSVAWSDAEEQVYSEKGIVMHQQDVLSHQNTTMSLIIKRRDGFTNDLTKKLETTRGRVILKALVEGPYGGGHSLHSYGTVILFAGGVGITHQIGYLRELINGYTNGTVAIQRIVLVWIIQSPEHLEWIRPWMKDILSMEKRRDILRIQLFVTRPRSTKEIHSPSATVQMFPGRPNIDTILKLECQDQIGAMAVTVCGTGPLADEVRDAVRRRQGEANIDFVEECFSW